jgi:hypothetical protein
MVTAYHLEGPYDATLISRNTNLKNSPVEAVRESNIAALRATPRENIRDALDKHVPLQGVAIIPPGMSGLDGKPMDYEEGADLMREEDAPGGAYKRWEGMVCIRLMNFDIFLFQQLTCPRTTPLTTIREKASRPSQSRKP